MPTRGAGPARGCWCDACVYPDGGHDLGRTGQRRPGERGFGFVAGRFGRGAMGDGPHWGSRLRSGRAARFCDILPLPRSHSHSFSLASAASVGTTTVTRRSGKLRFYDSGVGVAPPGGLKADPQASTGASPHRPPPASLYNMSANSEFAAWPRTTLGEPWINQRRTFKTAF